MPCSLLSAPDFRGLGTSGRGSVWLSPPPAREAVGRREQMIALIEYESHVQILRNTLSEETASQSALHAGTCAEKVSVQIQID